MSTILVNKSSLEQFTPPTHIFAQGQVQELEKLYMSCWGYNNSGRNVEVSCVYIWVFFFSGDAWREGVGDERSGLGRRIIKYKN